MKQRAHLGCARLWRFWEMAGGGRAGQGAGRHEPYQRGVWGGGVRGPPAIFSAPPPGAVTTQLLRPGVRSRLRQRNIDPKDPQFPLPPEEDEASQMPDQQRLDDV